MKAVITAPGWVWDSKFIFSGSLCFGYKKDVSFCSIIDPVHVVQVVFKEFSIVPDYPDETEFSIDATTVYSAWKLFKKEHRTRKKDLYTVHIEGITNEGGIVYFSDSHGNVGSAYTLSPDESNAECSKPVLLDVDESCVIDSSYLYELIKPYCNSHQLTLVSYDGIGVAVVVYLDEKENEIVELYPSPLNYDKFLFYTVSYIFNPHNYCKLFKSVNIPITIYYKSSSTYNYPIVISTDYFDIAETPRNTIREFCDMCSTLEDLVTYFIEQGGGTAPKIRPTGGYYKVVVDVDYSKIPLYYDLVGFKCDEALNYPDSKLVDTIAMLLAVKYVFKLGMRFPYDDYYFVVNGKLELRDKFLFYELMSCLDELLKEFVRRGLDQKYDFYIKFTHKRLKI